MKRSPGGGGTSGTISSYGRNTGKRKEKNLWQRKSWGEPYEIVLFERSVGGKKVDHSTCFYRNIGSINLRVISILKQQDLLRGGRGK